MIEFTICSLTLYAYQLASDTETERRNDAQQLWDHLAKICRDVLHLPELAQFKNHLVSEEGQDTRFLPLLGRENPSKGEKNKQWRVEIMPLRLHDVYAVDFTISRANSISPVPLEELHVLNPKGCLLPQNIKANLGQTLLLYLQPDLNTSIDEKFISQHIIPQLWKDSGQIVPEFAIETGRLFGSSFYEYTSVSQAKNATPVHLIIWIGQENSTETLDLAAKHNNQLMRLLASRHKIEYVAQNAQNNYHEARKLDREVKRKNEIFANLPDSKTDKLKSLKTLLAELPKDAQQFSEHLRALNDHQFTLTANLTNYRKLLDEFQEIKAGDNLELWEKFQNYAEKTTALQFSMYEGYLLPTQPLFQELTRNIQGLLQIETLEHEFNKREHLERLVVFIASTLESAAISAKVDDEHHFAQDVLGQAYPTISGIFSEHLTSIFAHLGVGLGFGLTAFLILLAYQQHVKKH